jgi:hypothetical protein
VSNEFKQEETEMARKPTISKESAVGIALRFAADRGTSASGGPEVSGSTSDRVWNVFIPDGSRFEPGGVMVLVDQDTGAARFLTVL